tara:strand:+ start:284 stop:832 length:549 start_codon:yes stop_codon:yes gene_type:complete
MKELFLILFLFTSMAVLTDARANTNTVSSNTVASTTVDKSVPTASAPPFNIMQNDSCYIPGGSIGIQTQVLGIATGKAFEDLDCNKRKYAKLLWQFNMKVSALNVLCTEPIVFTALERSGSPCPAGKGLIGQDAQDYWDEHPEERPDYEQWRTTNAVKETTEVNNDGLKDFALMALSVILLL